ncbi:MAG: alcohol dehydrogenase [Planctomycetes bacterium SCN 63-9]|nr:MAG: alcohol dehydrogenase [Planctomycetes bacterium SCN 63-9]
MNQRRLGRTGLKVSEICLGTMTFANQSDEATAGQIMDKAIDRGVTFIDTADCYPIPPDPDTAGSTEEIIGRWLAAAPGRREQLVLATKCRIRVGRGPNDQGLSRRHILAACEASLRRLRTDSIDLFQAHSPDPETPIDETLRAFDDLVRAGKVRYVGCSNYPAWQLALALGESARNGWARYDCAQPRYNAIYRDIETELLPLCRDQGIGVIAYNPLAGGLLSGKHAGQAPPAAGTRFTLGAAGELYRDRYWHSAQFEAIETLKKHCEEKGLNLATASIAWVLAQPGITSAIVGASRADQLDATLSAVDLTLDEETRLAFDSVWWTLPRRPQNR